jgi:molybdenum cofactor synthesis domain-containing protein
MTEFDLLHKTELRIERIRLQHADLNEVAAVVADVLDLEPFEVLVTDVVGDIVTLDILRQTVDAYALVGRQKRLFDALGRLPGVEVTQETSICSQGMLGWIALDEAEARASLKRSEAMAEEIRRRISKRAIVFSTGTEVKNGQIKDTNKPLIAERLEAEGYVVTQGPTLTDDMDYIAGRLRRALDSGGYGLIITTGGVGAELKDQTVEALLTLDPQAAVPYICRFEKGTGRHVKDGVRIGVAQVSGTLIIALPGPNHEVREGLEALVKGLSAHSDKNQLAEDIAAVLRGGLRDKMEHGSKLRAAALDAC